VRAFGGARPLNLQGVAELKCFVCAGFCLFGMMFEVSAQDVMEVARNHYQVLVDNEYVRALENTLAPGEKDPLHTYPAGAGFLTVMSS
jgi:hypothetical protein